MHRIISLFLLTMLLLTIPVNVSNAAIIQKLPVTAAALFDLTTGELLYEMNAEQKVFPASTTKVLTALLAVELGDLNDTVNISELAAKQPGTALYVKAGEQYLLQDLLYALLVHSDNDVAVAIAEHIAGSVEEFAQLMNNKAEMLGAKNSNFVNPNGLPHIDHFTTAGDMAKIFAAAWQNSLMRTIMATPVYYIDLPTGERRPLRNGNRMLTTYKGTLGGKTGYTKQAGNCLVVAAQSGTLKLGAAVFKAQGAAVFDAATSLLDYGFANWDNLELIHKEQAVTAVLAHYGTETLLAAGSDLHVTLARNEKNAPISRQIVMDKPLVAPLAAGATVGSVTYFLGNQELGTVELCVAHDVRRNWYTYWEVPVIFAGSALIWYCVKVRSKLLAARWRSVPKRR